MKLSSKLRSWAGAGQHGLAFFCPACQVAHSVHIGPGGWAWDGDADQPSLSSSVMIAWKSNPDAAPGALGHSNQNRCHSLIEDGMIEFLPDSTHELAGHIVHLADFPDYYQ
jgi:hypothetical protein